ncbi:hypothetical protein ABH940_005542 [Streptacidiphilus sp. BW17]|uniref:hypothetical protein n=1 Tax=Streptacidiphilus sp. BW17 TaxID=3156274 RepID=UPI003513C5B3
MPQYNDLIAICDHCLRAVDTGDGSLWVDQTQATHAAAPTTWRTTHDGCAAPPAGAYRIPLERVTNWAALLHWTAHLLDRPWLACTDWSDVLLRTLEPHHGAVSGLQPTAPRSLAWGGIGG